ncbi:MAG: response regulator [Elusimicrobiales bacterium]|nr:response regulator [Elusimicrobiales bacterium]
MEKKTLRILLVEDDPDDLALTRRVFGKTKAARMLLTAARSMKEALAAVAKTGFDAIVADLNLPDSRGRDTFDRLVEAAPETPLLLLTVVNDEDMALDLVNQGAQDYIVKGDLSPALLARAVFYAIERKDFNRKQAELVANLGKALTEVKTLSGLLPICAKCKRIRDSYGKWQNLEGYISSRTEAEFTHGFCPECAGKLYPEFSGKEKKGPK